MTRKTIAVSRLCIALLMAPICAIVAQSAPAQWRAWAFAHLGPALTSQVDTHGHSSATFASLSGGLAASYRAILGMVRATDTERLTFDDGSNSGVQDYAALAGARSRGDRLFVAGAAGIAQATPVDEVYGSLHPHRQLVPAFDLSAHADYRVAGLALTLCGVLGPASTRYIAISLGVELGWFGF